METYIKLYKFFTCLVLMLPAALCLVVFTERRTREREWKNKKWRKWWRCLLRALSFPSSLHIIPVSLIFSISKPAHGCLFRKRAHPHTYPYTIYTYKQSLYNKQNIKIEGNTQVLYMSLEFSTRLDPTFLASFQFS